MMRFSENLETFHASQKYQLNSFTFHKIDDFDDETHPRSMLYKNTYMYVKSERMDKKSITMMLFAISHDVSPYSIQYTQSDDCHRGINVSDHHHGSYFRPKNEQIMKILALLHPRTK